MALSLAASLQIDVVNFDRIRVGQKVLILTAVENSENFDQALAIANNPTFIQHWQMDRSRDDKTA